MTRPVCLRPKLATDSRFRGRGRGGGWSRWQWSRHRWKDFSGIRLGLGGNVVGWLLLPELREYGYVGVAVDWWLKWLLCWRFKRVLFFFLEIARGGLIYAVSICWRFLRGFITEVVLFMLVYMAWCLVGYHVIASGDLVAWNSILDWGSGWYRWVRRESLRSMLV